MSSSPKLIVCLLLLPLFHSSDSSLEGSLLLLRVFDGELITEVHPLPPTSGGSQSNQPLVGSLAGFSLSCGFCQTGALTSLSFERDSLRVLPVLADNVLSVVLVSDSLAKGVQVIPLGDGCTPLTLMEFYDGFVVVCADHSLYFGSISASLRVTLRDDHSSQGFHVVFLSSGREMKAINLVENSVEIYTINDATYQKQQLPPNIRCMNTSKPVLSPLHSQGAVLLQCSTIHGMIVYVVPIPVVRGVDARSISANGTVYPSQDGTYILVVNGPRIRIYTSAESGVPGKPVSLSSGVHSVDNLDFENVRLITDSKEHVVLNLKSGNLRRMPGGPPTLSQWVDPSNQYLYLTEDKEIFVFNETSTEPEYEPKAIADQPEMMLFVPGTNPTEPATTSPTQLNPTSSPTIPPKPPNYGTKVGAIVGGAVGIVVIVIAIIGTAFAIIALTCASKKRQKRSVVGTPPPFIRTESGEGQIVLHLQQNSVIRATYHIKKPGDDETGTTPIDSDTPTPPPDPLVPPTAPDRPPVAPTQDNLSPAQRHIDHPDPPTSPQPSDASDNEADSSPLLVNDPLSRESDSTCMSDIASIFPRPHQATDPRDQQPLVPDNGPISFGPYLVSVADNASESTSAIGEQERHMLHAPDEFVS